MVQVDEPECADGNKGAAWAPHLPMSSGHTRPRLPVDAESAAVPYLKSLETTGITYSISRAAG